MNGLVEQRMNRVIQEELTHLQVHHPELAEIDPSTEHRFRVGHEVGDVARSVAGGHADFNVNQPSEMLPHYPKVLLPIMSFQKQRPKAFPEAPTHWEKKLNGQWGALLDLETGLHQMRGVIGPPAMPKEAVAWYEDLFQKVFETEDWQNFMSNNAMSPIFMGADDYKAWLTRFEDNHARMMTEVFGWELRPDLTLR